MCNAFATLQILLLGHQDAQKGDQDGQNGAQVPAPLYQLTRLLELLSELKLLKQSVVCTGI